MTKGKDRRLAPGDPAAMFDTAPTMTPLEALLTGGGVILGGIALLALTLYVTRWLARR